MKKKVLNIAFWSIFGIVMLIWLVDFFRVQAESGPIFCLSNRTHTYEDGTVEECIGLGYKVYHYQRPDVIEGLEFGPFFISIREPETD